MKDFGQLFEREVKNVNTQKTLLEIFSHYDNFISGTIIINKLNAQRECFKKVNRIKVKVVLEICCVNSEFDIKTE